MSISKSGQVSKVTVEEAQLSQQEADMAFKLYNTIGQPIAVDAWFTASDSIEAPL